MPRIKEITYTLDGEPADYDIYGPGKKVTCRRVQAHYEGEVVGTLLLNMRGIHMLLHVRPDCRRIGVASGMFYAAKEAGWKPVRGAKDISPDAAKWADSLDWTLG
jgi:hypothetical protein